MDQVTIIGIDISRTAEGSSRLSVTSAGQRSRDRGVPRDIRFPVRPADFRAGSKRSEPLGDAVGLGLGGEGWSGRPHLTAS